MLFSKQTPERLRENQNASDFLKVLDGLQLYKESVVQKALRFYNPVLLTDLRFLRRVLGEFGWPAIPADFPKKILDNMYLNAENVMALKGSKMGIELFLRVLTCGEVTVDDGSFFPKPSYIDLDDEIYAGYLFTDTDFPNKILYLYSGEDNFIPRHLTIGIKTPYDTLQSLRSYIETHIFKFIPFTDANTTVTITFENGPFVKNPLAFAYFEDESIIPPPIPYS